MSNEIKKKLLGEPIGTAQNRLRKMLLFHLAGKLGLNICYRCFNEIETYKELSVEHTESWQTSKTPKETFFNLDKIRFSHLSCNCRATKKKAIKHPSFHSYKKGCRCADCTKFNAINSRKQRDKKKRSNESVEDI